MKKKILIVDDEEDIRTFLEYNLKKEGFETATAADGQEAYDKALSFLPDLILLDIMLPKIYGIDLCKKLKNEPLLSNTKIIALTAISQDTVQIEAFETGCDDFVNKPIKLKVLIARIKNRLKIGDPLHAKDFVLDKENMSIMRNSGERILLPKKEFEILELLLENKNKIVKRETIFNNIWGKEDIIVSDRTIDVYIRKLRQKIGERTIKTIKGIGYKFEE
jgi:two-component system alkaline phosphatase synthesis response regulator PhoP